MSVTACSRCVVNSVCQGMASGGSGRRSSLEPEKIIQQNTAGENAWKRDKDMASDEEETKTKDLFKKVEALLNKLTPNNFDELKMQAMNYPIDTEERLKGITYLIFEKAINEPAFSKTCAKLCKDLSQMKVPADSGNGNVHFYTLLINRCQKEFEKEKSEKVERDNIAQLPENQRAAALEDLEVKLIKNKKRMLGNICLIGELFKQHMLIEEIMHDCINKLLCSKDDESLECMVHLLMTIGKSLDHKKAKNRIDQYFKQIETITNQKAVSARIRFMLQDLLELRARNWVPRHADDNLKMIEQIQKDHKREEEQKLSEGVQAQAQLAAPPMRMSRNKQDQPPRVGPPQNEGWNTVSSKAARVSVDPNKFKVAKVGAGHTTFGGWSQGSSGGRSKAQSSQEAYRFMILSEEKKGSSIQPPSQPLAQVDLPLVLEILKDVQAKVSSIHVRLDRMENKLENIDGYFCKEVKHQATRDGAHTLNTPATLSTTDEPLSTDGHLAALGVSQVSEVSEVLAQAEDMALDISLIWKYLGEIIGSVFRDNSLSLTILGEMMDSAREARKAGNLMAEILLTAVKINGANVVAEMWKSAGFTWEMFLPDDKDVQEFVNNKKLEFTLIASSRGLTSSGGDANVHKVVTDEEWVSLIERELGRILRRNDDVNNEVFDWVQKNLNISSSKERRLFIRALMTVVVQSTVRGEGEKYTLNRDLLVQRMAILKRYINNDSRLELEALYSVQALNQHLENPPQLLGHFFDVFFDEDVIPEEAFYAWKDSTDPNETLGKGVALKSVTSFFVWLREVEEELQVKKVLRDALRK